MVKRKSQEWNPYKSKWKAALEKGLDIPLKEKDNVLYLGASSGTTVSHISKLTKGIIFAVENSPQMAIRLVKLAEKRTNIAPIFSDARDVGYLKKMIFGKKINILFQDIPSIDQVEILIKNSKLVDEDCRIFFSLKTQSISQQDYKRTSKEIDKKIRNSFEIVKKVDLKPFHKKHYFYILKKILNK